MRVHSKIKNILGLTCLLSLQLCGHAMFDRGFLAMKQIPLTHGMVALVDDEDFDWLNQWKWHIRGSSSTQYAHTQISTPNGRIAEKYAMHRLILGITDSDIFCDHIDGNGLNNQRSNLRQCSRSQNLLNKKIYKNNKSGYKGVSWHAGNCIWISQICINNKRITIGYFKNKIDAAKAYNEAAIKYHGEFAKINII